MIYIVKWNDRITKTTYTNSVWEVKGDVDVEQSYSNFLAAKAEELGIVINEHWHNIMNRENHHPHLTEEEYETKVKQWKKVLRRHNIESYLGNVLRARKVEFKEIYK